MKWLSLLCLALFIMACNSNDTEEGGTAPLPTNIDNVNGNIPDTTSGTTLNTPMEIDSLHRDSLQH